MVCCVVSIRWCVVFRIRHGDDVDFTLPVTEPGGWSDYGNRHTQNISLSRADRRTRGASKLAYILIALCVLGKL